MRDSQLLSPTLGLLQQRLASMPFVDGTIVSLPSKTVVDATGKEISWSALMETVLMEFFAHAKHEEVPVHPAVETYEVTLGGRRQLAARVRSGCHLPANCFLGFYQGWVGTAEEAMLLISEDAPLLDRKNCCCGWPGAKALLKRAQSTMHFQSYAVGLAEVNIGGGRKKKLVTSCIGPGGKYVGNTLGRINDRRANPFASASNHAAGLAPLAGGDKVEGGARDRDRPSNVKFVQIMHSGWYYLGKYFPMIMYHTHPLMHSGLGIVTCQPVAEGEELLSFPSRPWVRFAKVEAEGQVGELERERDEWRTGC